VSAIAEQAPSRAAAPMDAKSDFQSYAAPIAAALMLALLAKPMYKGLTGKDED